MLFSVSHSPFSIDGLNLCVKVGVLLIVASTCRGSEFLSRATLRSRTNKKTPYGFYFLSCAPLGVLCCKEQLRESKISTKRYRGIFIYSSLRGYERPFRSFSTHSQNSRTLTNKPIGIGRFYLVHFAFLEITLYLGYYVFLEVIY